MIALQDLRLYTGYLALATLIFALITYKNYSNTNAKYFIFSIAYAVITEFASLHFNLLGDYYTSIFGQTNFPIANIFTIVQISFFLWWIRHILNAANRKKIIGIFIILYWCFAGINIACGQPFMTDVQMYTYAVGVILLLIAISFYFIESFNKETIFNITDSIYFWFIFGVLLFYATFMPFMFAFRLFLQESQLIFSIVTFGLNAIMYICFAIGFYKSYKIKNQEL